MGRKGCYQHGSSAEYTRQAKPRKESGMSAEQTAVSLVPMTPNKMALVSPMLEKAQSLTVATKDDAALARAFGKEINAMIATIKADFEKPKKATDEAHKAVVAQEKSHLDPLNVAKEVVSGKITAWDGAERKRIEEERRLLAQEDERKRQAILEAARKKLDKLMEGMTDDRQLLTVLNASLNIHETTEEEAEVIRAQIRTVEARIATTVERAQVVEQKVEEASQPIAPDQSAVTVKRATGVSLEKVITAVNMKVFLRWLASDECTIDASTVIKVQDGAMKQLVQRMNMPGVSWKYQAKTRF